MKSINPSDYNSVGFIFGNLEVTHATSCRPGIQVIKKYHDIPSVKCFLGQLNQVFMNILANAIAALEDDNPGRSFAEIQADPHCITIQTALADPDTVTLQIADNGTGMPESVQQKIFDH